MVLRGDKNNAQFGRTNKKYYGVFQNALFMLVFRDFRKETFSNPGWGTVSSSSSLTAVGRKGLIAQML